MLRQPAAPQTPLILLTACACGWYASTAGADWNQWRGPQRDGSTTAVSLRTELPQSGLAPLWMNLEDFQSSGGWSSPIVAEGRVFQYSHGRIRREEVELPPEKYPNLNDEQRQKLSPEELKLYEDKRSAERQERQALQFQHVDQIVCLDALTGERLWEHHRDSASTRWRQSSTPAVADGLLYYVGADRQFVCLDARDGAELWLTEIPVETGTEEGAPSPISSSPVVAEGRVIVLAERLVAMNAKDGEILWTGATPQDGAIYSSPAIWKSRNGTRVVANVGNAGTVCVDLADGRELWRVESFAGRSTPVVSGDMLLTYGSSRKGGLRRYEMSDETAELVWTSNRFADSGSSPVIADGRVFVQGDRYFACLDLEDGRTLWRTTLTVGRPRYTSPIAAGNRVFYTFGGVLCIPTASDGFAPSFDARIDREGVLATEAHFRQKLDLESLPPDRAEKVWNEFLNRGPRQCVSPALVEGRLYLRLNNGIVCYDLKQTREN